MLAGLTHRTAALATWQGDTPAMRLYRARGWREVLRDLQFPGTSYIAVILGLDLRPHHTGKTRPVR
jgi:hypothetical protein